MNFLCLDIAGFVGYLKLVSKVTELAVVGVDLKDKWLSEAFLGADAEGRVFMDGRRIKKLGFTVT